MSNKKIQVDPSNTAGNRSNPILIRYQIRHEEYGIFQGIDPINSEVVWHKYNGMAVEIFSIQFKATGEEIMYRISDLTGIPFEDMILEKFDSKTSFWLAKGVLFSYGIGGHA